MSDWNIRRKARGRIRRAKLRRRRQRITAAGIVAMLFTAVFAVGAVTIGEKRETRFEIAKSPSFSYSIPRISPMLARAESDEGLDEIPQLLKIQERFPDYKDRPEGNKPDDESEEPEETPEAEEQPQVVILDDLRAAPPKSMFIKAVFENARTQENQRPVTPRGWMFQDFEDGDGSIFGRKHRKQNPPIPEPGTGTLLGLGLTAVAGWRTKQRRVTDKSETTLRK
ncbi:MAG: hypothetical protein ACI8W3_002765 [Myxococcota bacterium]|jgi:hypothetical protein